MDLQMPGTNGYKAAVEIRALEKELAVSEAKKESRQRTPIIALSADILTGTKDACFANGMNAYLSKPLNIHSLLDILERYLYEKADRNI
jgi:CheY-like chemotaxis protein